MKIMISTFFVFCICPGFSQIQKPLEYYTNSVDSIYSENLNLTITRLENSKPKRWTYYVPSIGYDVINNRFAFSYSITRFVNLFKVENDQLLKIEELTRNNDQELKTSVLVVTNKYIQLSELYVSYVSFLLQFDILSQLAEIHHEQYKHNQLSLEVFLSKKLSYLHSVHAVDIKKSEIERVSRELEALSKKEVLVHLPQSKPYTYE